MNRMHACPKQENRERSVRRLDDNLFVMAQQWGVSTQHLSQESPLAALISQTCNNAYKGKRSTDLSDLSLNLMAG